MKKKLVLAILGLAVVLVVGGLFVSCSKKDEASAETKKETVVKPEKEKKKEKKTEYSKEEVKNEDEETKTKTGTKDEKVESETKTSTKGTTSGSSSKNTSNTNSSVVKNETPNKKENTSNTSTPTNKEESNKKEESTTNKKEEDKHSHDWQAVYKEVDKGHWDKELVKEAWTEEIPQYTMVWVIRCNGCGIVLKDNEAIDNHLQSQALQGNFACGGYTTRQEKTQIGTKTVEHPAEYKDVWVPSIVKELDYYKCSCGATK